MHVADILVLCDGRQFEEHDGKGAGHEQSLSFHTWFWLIRDNPTAFSAYTQHPVNTFF